MPLTIRVDCPHCHHAQMRVGEPSHIVNTRPTGFYVDPAIECPSCHAPFVVRGSRAHAVPRPPPPGTKLPDAPTHSTPPPKLKATPTTPEPEPPNLSFREAQAACKKRGLPATGTRSQLLARLAEAPP